jgi:ketosteroid isomerase-like protein
LRRVSESNVDVVRRLFDLFGEGRGIEPALEVMHPDVVIEIPPNMSAEPDTYRGHAGVIRYFEGFEGMLDEVQYEAIEFISAGDAVIAYARMSGRGASSGLDVGLDSYVVHELLDGKLVRMTPYPDLESARAALERRG